MYYRVSSTYEIAEVLNIERDADNQVGKQRFQLRCNTASGVIPVLYNIIKVLQDLLSAFYQTMTPVLKDHNSLETTCVDCYLTIGMRLGSSSRRSRRTQEPQGDKIRNIL